MKKKLFLLTLVHLFSIIHCVAITIYYDYGYSNQAACNQSTGNIEIMVWGGTPPYTYLWSNSFITQDLYNVPAGTYTLTVHDMNGDSAVTTIAVGNQAMSQFAPNFPPYNVNVFMACNSQCNGYIVIKASNLHGTAPYIITSTQGNVLYNYPADSYINSLCPNQNVTVTITDALGCSGSQTFSLSETPNQSPSFSVTPSCNSLANGSVTVSNVITSWSYWGIGMTIVNNPSVPNCSSGNYSSVPFTVSNLTPGTHYLAITYSQTNYSCNDFNYFGCPRFYSFYIPDLGTNCSTVGGDVFVDLNANCTEDAGEIGVPNTIIEFTPGPYYAYTNSAGHYSSNLVWGNFNMTQYPPATLTQLCPAANPYPISLSSSNTNVTVNFADTSNIPFDVAAHISHGAAHPGFNFSYGVSVQNLSYTASGMLAVTLNYDPLLSFVSANPAPFSTSAGQVVWQLNSITNFQSTSAYIVLSVPPNPALIGDTLFPNVNVQATTAETNLTNNTVSTRHIITGSFDPNVKTVEQPAASFIPAADGWFNYTIQFQNTGNDTAFNVEVIDTLDSDLNVTTFVPGAASHPFTINITGQGVLHFYFNNIYLPDSTTDEPNSHGFISFRIRSKQNLPHGTIINNQSDIVFDFNPPVATNTTQNIVDLTLAINASATTICAGQPVTLTMIPELQNTAWRWRTGTCSGMLVGNGNSITVSPTVTTTYFVRDSAGTIPLGCCYRKTIVVNALPNASVTPSGPTTFCQGNSVTLTATATANYLWSTGATAQSINVTATGNYSVTVTNAAGCSNTSTAVSVTVNSLPTASITPNGPTTFCAGNSVLLTAGGANNYLWSNSSIAQSISVSTTGNYLVTVTDGNNCSASTSLSVTVNSLPVASITPNGPTTFCSGNSVLLTAGGANNYLWSNSSTAQSISVSTTGNYLVTVTDGNNCSASTSLSVTMNPLPNASITPNGPTTFCSGNSVLLTAGGANNYLWSNSSTSQNISVSASGTYFVTVTDGNNCSASTSLSVTVNPNPPVPNIIQVLDSLFSDAANGYQWYFNSALISGATSQFYHPTQNGNYSVVITDVNNCTATSTGYPFYMTGVIGTSRENEIIIYPNPAENKLAVSSLQLAIISIEICDAVGKLNLIRKPEANSQKLLNVIDVSNLFPGIYFVKVKTEKGIFVRKFVKQ